MSHTVQRQSRQGSPCSGASTCYRCRRRSHCRLKYWYSIPCARCGRGTSSDRRRDDHRGEAEHAHHLLGWAAAAQRRLAAAGSPRSQQLPRLQLAVLCVLKEQLPTTGTPAGTECAVSGCTKPHAHALYRTRILVLRTSSYYLGTAVARLPRYSS